MPLDRGHDRDVSASDRVPGPRLTLHSLSREGVIPMADSWVQAPRGTDRVQPYDVLTAYDVDDIMEGCFEALTIVACYKKPATTSLDCLHFRSRLRFITLYNYSTLRCLYTQHINSTSCLATETVLLTTAPSRLPGTTLFTAPARSRYVLHPIRHKWLHCINM